MKVSSEEFIETFLGIDLNFLAVNGLHEYLHDHGFTLREEPASASGEVDLIAVDANNEELFIEAKVFNALTDWPLLKPKWEEIYRARWKGVVEVPRKEEKKERGRRNHLISLWLREAQKAAAGGFPMPATLSFPNASTH